MVQYNEKPNGTILRFTLEIEADGADDLTAERANKLLIEMEDILNKNGLSIYDTRIEDDNGWYPGDGLENEDED